MRLASVQQGTGSDANPRNSSAMNFSTPAGWAMFYFAVSVVILGLLFLSM